MTLLDNVLTLLLCAGVLEEEMSNKKIYMVEKEAIYLHGVFWIGSNLDEAVKKADDFAGADRDSHHYWAVREFSERDLGDAAYDAGHKTVYIVSKGAAGVFDE